MASKPTLVIVGAGLTGGAAASTMRDDGFDGRVIIVGEELHPPYERPPLSKEYLRGEQSFDSALLRPPEWFKENEVELLLGQRAAAVDPSDRVVELGGGERIPYDSVLLATGGRNRRLQVPGADLEGILDLRTVEDADRIRAHARPGQKAVVVGAGFIGCEVAASLRLLGTDVEVVEVFDVPLTRAIGPDVGKVFEAIHRDRGVVFHLRDVVAEFRGARRVEEVITASGEMIACDFVVVGVGIEPVTDVARGAGIELDNGVVVDEYCQTSAQGIYAAGDVANHFHPVFGRRMRVEHFDNALKQGASAARNMLGRRQVFDDLHWFWSDQYDVNLQYLGSAPEWDAFVVRGSMEDRSFVGFYLKDGLVEAVVGVNRGREVRRSAGLIRARRPVDLAALRDEDVDLRTLVASTGGGA